MHISILGKGLSGLACPFDADETWGVNNVASQLMNCPDCNGEGKVEEVPCVKCEGTGKILWYPQKIHKLFAFDSALEPGYIEDMKKYSQVVSWQPWADIAFPLEEIKNQFKTAYFTNTISYMVAYAIYLKVDKISVYGVDASFGAPYAQENRGVEYWLGRAEQAGIELYLPEKCHILRTVSGNLYGEINDCNMLMYLHERLNLINALPKEGTYSDALKAQNAWWVLFPKEDEAKAHGVSINRLPDGSLNFSISQGEYASDIHTAPEVWDYLRALLISLEKEGKLNFNIISIYEKIVLGKEDPKAGIGDGH